MDDFKSLSQRLLNRCPSVGIALAQQLINDSWREMQSKREWSFRRRTAVFAPPLLYSQGSATTNVALGAPTLVTGIGTNWTPNMIGRQIRIGGYLFPFYTIAGWQSPTAITLDQPWQGDDVTAQSYNILQAYFPVPSDFGYIYTAVSIKDGFRLWTNLTQADLAMLDPQRTNFGQTYAVVYRDFSSQFGGFIGPAINTVNPSHPTPISTTTNGFTYPFDTTYIIRVVVGGFTGNATFVWMRAGQLGFTPEIATSDQPQDLSDGVQIYWPDNQSYDSLDIIIINCKSQVMQAVPRYELWPAPTFSAYLYPYIYISKEYDLTAAQPQLPPFIANRGEILLEMGLEKCAEFPGQDADHINIYHDLRQAKWHSDKVKDMMIDLQRNDEEVGVTNIDYQMYPFAPAPWLDGQWEQTHAPFLNG